MRKFDVCVYVYVYVYVCVYVCVIVCVCVLVFACVFVHGERAEQREIAQNVLRQTVPEREGPIPPASRPCTQGAAS